MSRTDAAGRAPHGPESATPFDLPTTGASGDPALDGAAGGSPPAEEARPQRRFTGIAVGEGIAIGPVFRVTEPTIEIVKHKISASDMQAEGARLDAAVLQSRKQVAKLRARLAALPEDSQAEIAPLLDAYLLMLGESRLLRGARRRIAETLVNAETAVVAEAELIAVTLSAADEENGPRQAYEVREVARRLVRNLVQAPFRSFADLPQGAVLVAESLRPADAALIDPARVAGVATEEGGTDGHTAIMLRALGVPTVLGAAGLASGVQSGDTIVVDGGTGHVVLNPDEGALLAARRGIAAYARERQRLGRLRRLPAETLDGELIDLQANLELPLELPLIARAGAHGIGLFRSEFLFMNRETLPDQDEQAESYRTVIEAMDGDPVTIRVLDWGGEKQIEALSAAGVVPDIADANPALGMRGIRLLLRRPALFETQLAAILRASLAGPVQILLPMVTCVAEIRSARAIYQRVVAELRAGGVRLSDPAPPLGIMVETPGAALSADALAAEAEFFAIGTNDLAMYTLAVDRGDADVAHLYDPLHPAMLRLIQFTTEAAVRHRIPVSVCGEMAANPRLVPLLIGLGLRRFSMNAAALPRVKRMVRGTTVEDCVRLAWDVMQQTDSGRIERLIGAFSA